MSEVNKCPKCGGALEHGFIHYPRGLYWDTKEHKFSARFLEQLTSMSYLSRTMPRTQALRCTNCRLVIFNY